MKPRQSIAETGSKSASLTIKIPHTLIGRLEGSVGKFQWKVLLEVRVESSNTSFSYKVLFECSVIKFE